MTALFASLLARALPLLAWARRLIGAAAPWRGLIALGLGAALILGVWAWTGALRAANDAQRAAIARLERDLLRENARADDNLRAAQALELALKAALERAAAYHEAREEALHADPDDDGPVAPVLERVLERLRDNEGRSRALTN